MIPHEVAVLADVLESIYGSSRAEAIREAYRIVEALKEEELAIVSTEGEE